MVDGANQFLKSVQMLPVLLNNNSDDTSDATIEKRISISLWLKIQHAFGCTLFQFITDCLSFLTPQLIH
jgi:hypothetical protein